MTNDFLTAKEQKAVKELRRALYSLPSKLVLSLDDEGRVVVSKLGVAMSDYREDVSEEDRLIERKK